MSSVIEIISKIKERKSGFKVTDDFPIPDELILSTMNDVRETLIREEFNNSGRISDKYYQYSCCNKIECINETCEYNNKDIPINSDMYKISIPSLISKVGQLDVKYLGYKKTTYNRYDFMELLSLDARIWTKNSLGFSLVGNELRINRLITPEQKFMCGMFLLQDPTKDCEWDKETTNYPVPSEFKLIRMTLAELRGGAKDELNNASDDLTPPKIDAEIVANSEAQDPRNRQQSQQKR